MTSPSKCQTTTGTFKVSVKVGVEQSGSDWNAGLKWHKHQTDIKTCGLGLWNIWRFVKKTTKQKKKDVHICLLTDACSNCLFFLHQTLSPCLLWSHLRQFSPSTIHTSLQYVHVHFPWRFWAEIMAFHSVLYLISATPPSGHSEAL